MLGDKDKDNLLEPTIIVIKVDKEIMDSYTYIKDVKAFN